jgi:hypothetical protein
MIARLDNLRKHPAVFHHLTGLTSVAFDELAADLVRAVEAALSALARSLVRGGKPTSAE